ncbi:unnamed protein product [Dicrocoelium dendriticum]|nr:unnamed protein product [Dicrocoelium dendriticum]
MAELSFLSTDVDNDPENTEDDSLYTGDAIETVNQSGSSKKTLINTFDNITEYREKTVEICQNTVNPHNRVNAENFNIQRVIGKGGYGKVFLVQKVDGVDQGKLYAMKVLKKARLVCNEKDKAHTVSERNILQMLRHPFLVKLHYAFQNHSNLYIVLEYCPGGELFNYLEREGALLENAACFYASEIILAIGHLHSLGIIYRDLKSENVLLDRQGHVKLTDFGLSKEGFCTTNTFCGTIEYMAPEIIKCEGHGKAVDWWSLGTLLFDMLSGGPPFSQEESREATTHKILTAAVKFPPSFSPEVTSLIRGLLKRDPKERLGSKEDVEEIKRHKFFRCHDISWSDVYHRRLRPPFRPKLAADNDVSMFDPTFTRLQPVVSPSDSGRPIPPDMFQGFSYVAPSVCEDSMRDSLPDSQSSSRRRQFGNRGAPSTGRLRRLDGAPAHWAGRPDGPPVAVAQDIHSRLPKFQQLALHASATTDTLNERVLNIVDPACEHRTAQPIIPHDAFALVSSTVSHVACSSREGCGVVNGTKTSAQLIDPDGDVKPTENEEEEEEEEEENVPGAKQIQSTQPSGPAYLARSPFIESQPTSDYFHHFLTSKASCGNLLTATSNQNRVLTGSRSSTQLRSNYIPSTTSFVHRKVVTSTHPSQAHTVNHASYLSSVKSSGPRDRRTAHAVPPTSTTAALTTNAFGPDQPNVTSNSKCSTM